MNPAETWKKYWKDKNIKNGRLSDRLSSYQIPVYEALRDIVGKYGAVNILSAGSGQDIISLNLQRRFKGRLKITVLDISGDVLEWNERLFKAYGQTAGYLKADIFNMLLPDDSCDIVFNTGVLEHFSRHNQVKMTKEIMRVLKPGGFFLAANPSAGGKIYRRGMAAAREKNIWPYGEENPIESLDFLREEIASVDSVNECHKDFLSQLGFLPYVNPCYKLIAFPAIYLSRLLYSIHYIPKVYDFLFAKRFGTYLVISIIRKKR